MSVNRTEELRDKVISLMKEYGVQLRVLDMAEQTSRLGVKMEEFRQGIFQVLFTGQFDAGKSTTLNAIMHQKLLSVSINPETPVIVRIVNGSDSDKVVITYRDRTPDQVMPLRRFQEEYRLDHADKEKFRNILYVTVERKMPLDTVVFVDSPGLGNTDVDDFIANDFSKNADAVVFMMHATQAMSKPDREYIQKNFEKRQLTNVFFVVNWYNLVQPQDDEAFKKKVRDDLYPVFEDADGKFNEVLYNQRVFFVDSFTAECFRTNTPKTTLVGRREVTIDLTDEDVRYSGIPDFEKALLTFLQSSDKDRAGYRSYLPRMGGMFRESMESVGRRKKDALAPIEQLEKDEKRLSENIKELEETLNGVETVFSDTMHTIMLNTGSSYDDFVRSVENDWDEYFAGIEVDFGFKQAAQVVWRKTRDFFGDIRRFISGDDESPADKLARDAEFQKIVTPLTDAIQAYVEKKAGEMGTNVIARSDTAINRMNKSLTEYCHNLEELERQGVDLTEIVRHLATGSGANIDDLSKEANMAQVLISILLFNNFDDALSGMLGGGQSWGQFIKSMLLTEITELAILMVVEILTGMWLFYVIARVVFGLFRLNKNVQTMGEKILRDPEHKSRNQVVEALKEQRDSTLARMEIQFNQKFMGNYSRLTDSVKVDLDQKRSQLAKLIVDRKQQGFDAQREAERMDGALQKMLEVYNRLAQLLEGRTYTRQEVLGSAVSSLVEEAPDGMK